MLEHDTRENAGTRGRNGGDVVEKKDEPCTRETSINEVVDLPVLILLCVEIKSLSHALCAEHAPFVTSSALGACARHVR